jgi:hypothetical protein
MGPMVQAVCPCGKKIRLPIEEFEAGKRYCTEQCFELYGRRGRAKKSKVGRGTNPNKRGAMVERVCAREGCGAEFLTPIAVYRRGWGLYCSKSCHAKVKIERVNRMKPWEARNLTRPRAPMRPPGVVSEAMLFLQADHKPVYHRVVHGKEFEGQYVLGDRLVSEDDLVSYALQRGFRPVDGETVKNDPPLRKTIPVDG